MQTGRYRATVLAWTAASLAAAVALRYGLIEPEALGLVCRAVQAPWWCLPRETIILAFHSDALGLVSLACGVAAHVPWRSFGGAGPQRLWADLDRPRLHAGLALGVGAAGLVLYNASLAAVGFTLGLIRAVRP
jgi:hypothetical protein